MSTPIPRPENVSDQPTTAPSAEGVADSVIAEYGGDARAAVVELVAIVRHLSEEIGKLSAASSPGFARRAPRGVKPK
jgi:hypothetical protein